jgi:transcriptional regulator with XRE-family HTH domain
MKTSQSYIARIEGGRVRPSTAVLERLAKATGTRLNISFEPENRPTRAEVLKRLKAQPARRLKRSAAEVIRTERDFS